MSLSHSELWSWRSILKKIISIGNNFRFNALNVSDVIWTDSLALLTKP